MTSPTTRDEARERLARAACDGWSNGNLQFDDLAEHHKQSWLMAADSILALLSDQPLPSVATGHPEQGALLPALEVLRRECSLLLQNAEGCAVNHYGGDHELFGMPGWLADARTNIEAALCALSDGSGHCTESTTDASQASGTNPKTPQTKGGE